MIHMASKLLWLLPCAIIAGLCYRISVSYGNLAGKSCLYAIILSFFGMISSSLPVIVISDVQPAKVFMAFLVGLIMRLFVVIFGSVIVLYLFEIDVLWFIGWLSFFYLMVLVVETYYSIMLLKQHSLQGNRQNEDD